MSQNIISLVLTDAQIKSATDALTALEGALGGCLADGLWDALRYGVGRAPTL